MYKNIDFNQSFCDELHDKKLALHKHRKEISTIILGGSHINYGINPICFDAVTLNFGFTSMDFFAMWCLIRRYCKKCPKLQNIVVRIGVFSPGFDLSRTNEKWRCFYYKHILKIPYAINLKCKGYTTYKKFLQKRNIDENFLGYKKQTWFGSWAAKERYLGHEKNFYRKDSQLKYLSLINTWCTRHNKRLICIITPHRSDYVAEASKDVMLQLENYVHKYAPDAEFYSFFMIKIL